MKEKRNKSAGPAFSQELMASAKRGDRDALTALYEGTQQEIYRGIRAMIRSEDLAMDVLQETYLKAFTHLDQLSDAERFLPWLRRIASNECMQQLRRNKPLLFSEIVTEEGEEPDFPDETVTAAPELSLERKENVRLIREILGGLTDAQRLLIGLYYYEQRPVREISEELGLSEGAVKAQLYRGRRRIEKEVRRLEDEGVKLYGMAPMPFLLALLNSSEPAARAGKKALPVILAKSGAGEAAALHVGRRFFETALGRVVLGAMAVSVIGGGVLGCKQWKENHEKNERVSITLNVTLPAEESDPVFSPDPSEDLIPDQPTVPAPETESTQPAPEGTEPVPAVESQEELLPVTSPETEPWEAPEDTLPQETAPPESEPTEPESTEPPVTEPPVTEPHVTEPSVTEPQPTETEPTKPQPTEPETPDPRYSEPQPTQPPETEPEPTQPPETEPEPTQPPETEPEPTQPPETEPEPTQPPETEPEPTEPPVTEPEQTEPPETDPEPTEPIFDAADAPPEILDWTWQNGQTAGDLYDLHMDDVHHLYIYVNGSEVPKVYADQPGVVYVSYEGVYDRDNVTEPFCYIWEITLEGAGTTQLICELGGSVQRSLTIENPAHPSVYRMSQFDWWQGEDFENHTLTELLIGNHDILWVYVEGFQDPVLYTDNPDVLSISQLYRSEDWAEINKSWEITVIGFGTAHLYVELDGSVVDSYTVDCREEPAEVRRFAWYYEPQYFVFSGKNDYIANYIDLVVEGNEMPNVYTDQPDLLGVSVEPFDIEGRVREFHVRLRLKAPGEAHIYCEFKGEILYDFTVNITE